MKTTAASAAPGSSHLLCATVAATLALTAFTSLAFAQAVVDPDPDMFDGTKTKREAIKQQQDSKSAVDDWEGGNMVVYDTNGKSAQGEQGNGQGGSGSEGGGQGMDIGVNASIPGLPIPLSGGGAGQGQGGVPPLQLPAAQPPGMIPTGQNAAMPPGSMPPGGMAAGGMQGADMSGAAQSSARPSAVSIGDPSQQIKTKAQGQAGNTPGPAEGGEPGAKEAGEDSTQVPSAASVPQSGNRGGGVEKGDAMPPDQI